jgi:hypothetical protein
MENFLGPNTQTSCHNLECDMLQIKTCPCWKSEHLYPCNLQIGELTSTSYSSMHFHASRTWSNKNLCLHHLLIWSRSKNCHNFIFFSPLHLYICPCPSSLLYMFLYSYRIEWSPFPPSPTKKKSKTIWVFCYHWVFLTRIWKLCTNRMGDYEIVFQFEIFCVIWNQLNCGNHTIYILCIFQYHREKNDM